MAGCRRFSTQGTFAREGLAWRRACASEAVAVLLEERVAVEGLAEGVAAIGVAPTAPRDEAVGATPAPPGPTTENEGDSITSVIKAINGTTQNARREVPN